MPLITEISVRKTAQRLRCDAGELDLNFCDRVLVETEHGLELGHVCKKEEFVKEDIKPDGKILRKINEDDLKNLQENKKREKEAARIVRQKIEDIEIEMHLTSVEYNFDRSKLFIYYTAENRVDFREFIKSLGHILKTRIQMVQIGVRDETKMLGGLGICGRQFCCKSFLKEFSAISIDMAKNQDLALNIQKLSGNCGRLLCCLSYEDKYYECEKKKFPKVGSNVTTPQGQGKVVSCNYITHTVLVALADGIQKNFGIDQIKTQSGR